MTILEAVASGTRVVIAGGGVLGTMHAVAARRRGFEVVQLEREAGARGASVRNFGLVWVSGRKAGPELDLALRARELWSELGAEVPRLGFRAAGSLTLATGDAELALLKEAIARPDAERRGFELLDPAAARAVNPALRGEFAGGLTIGDTHEYAEPFGFDLDEDAYDHLRARAEALLGTPIPRVRRRWAGVYSEVNPAAAAHALYHRSEAEPGVVLVTGPGGRGMTCSPAIAEETFS
jgi:glycine/D-amino acid oxidase-like deaminating enzyme